MSVHNTDNDNANGNSRPVESAVNRAFAADAAAGNASTQTNAGQKAQANRPARGSIFDVNSRFGRPVDRNSNGEVVQNFMKALTKEGENTLKQQFSSDFKLLVLDNNSGQVAMSCILVCFTQNIGGKHHTGVFTLIVEGSAAKFGNRFDNINGVQVEVQIVAGDTFNRTLWERITQAVKGAYGAAPTIYNAGAMVLPSELSPEDTKHIHRVWFNATQALYTVIDEQIGQREQPFTVAMAVADPTAVLTATLDYNPLTVDSSVGLPIRSDLSVSLRATRTGQNQELHDQSLELSKVDSFIDLVYNDPGQQQLGYGMRPVTQRYYARNVITNADTDINALTLELHLLTLSTSTLLTQNTTWGAAFLPKYGQQDAQLRDLGAVGYEVDFGVNNINGRLERIDTKAESFTKLNLYEMIQSAIHPSLIFSLDIEETGEQSWLSATYIEAANGSPTAHQAIIDAANNLTEGKFGLRFKGDRVAIDDLNRIHNGYFKGSDGLLHDIREIDYLAVLNLQGGKDLQVVIDWAATYDNIEIPMNLRLERRAKILAGLIEGGVHLKGYSRRITFNPDFLVALNQSCADAGLVIRPNNTIQDFYGAAGRVQYGAAAMAIQPGANASGLFAVNQPLYGNNSRTNMGGGYINRNNF